MLKELVQFTQAAAELKEIGAEPKYGLYICLRLVKTEGHWSIDPQKAETIVYTGKEVGSPDFLKKCQSAVKNAWMIDPWKCLDAPEKAIHSCSPYMVAFKKESLQKEKKVSLARRLDRYFPKAYEYLQDPTEKGRLDVFKNLLNSDDRLQKVLNLAKSDFEGLKEKHYVFIFLDEPIEKYQASHTKYLTEKLFNTAHYNMVDEKGEVFGTSGFFNTFSNKISFLTHQSASFSISGRISLKEAQALFEFENLLKNKPPLLPNPVPIFIMADEREDQPDSPETVRKRAFKLFKEDARRGGDERKPYLEIIKELWQDFPDQIGNYYLVFSGIEKKEKVIRDFDFVSRFEYELKDSTGKAWELRNLFTQGDIEPEEIRNVAHLAAKLPDFFNSQMIFKWFDELKSKYFKKPNNHQLVLKYRKAFYDFIFKSQRQSVTGRAIEEILLTGILDDMQMDEYKKLPGFARPINTEERNICTKLNLLFSLRQYFKPINPLFMPAKIEELVQRVKDVAAGTAHLEKDEHFAFAAGQVLARIFLQNESANRTYKMLDPYFRFTDVGKFRESLQEFFLRYAHKGYSGRFERVSSEVFSFELEKDLKSQRPLILAGVFYRELVRKGDKTFRTTLLHAEQEVQEADSAETTPSND
ncbi:MAG: hypothetical protein ACK4Q5_04120 [Saprospiraceae bacterium]